MILYYMNSGFVWMKFRNRRTRALPSSSDRATIEAGLEALPTIYDATVAFTNAYAGLQGGVGTTVETSDAGANSAIFTIFNTGFGSYTFTITTAGTNYNSESTVTYAGLQGGVGTTVETSDSGANSAIVTIYNTNSGAYTFAVTTVIVPNCCFHNDLLFCKK